MRVQRPIRERRGICPRCGAPTARHAEGWLYDHATADGATCPGSGEDPATDAPPRSRRARYGVSERTEVTGSRLDYGSLYGEVSRLRFVISNKDDDIDRLLDLVERLNREAGR